MNKNSKNSDGPIPEEVLELIPWYAIGTLSVDDHAFFEKALVSYPSLQQKVELEKQMLETVSADHSILNKSAIANQDERLKSVLNMIDAIEAKPQSENTRTSTGDSLFGKLKSAFDSLIAVSDVKPQYTRFAGLGILVLSVAVLTAFVAPLFTDENEFTPASAVTQTADKKPLILTGAKSSQTVLLVGFKGTSSELGENPVLKGKVSKIETVPEKENMYQVSFNQNMSAAEIKKMIDALQDQKQKVWFAGEAF